VLVGKHVKCECEAANRKCEGSRRGPGLRGAGKHGAAYGLLTGAAGQINGTTAAGHNVDRVGVGTGVYSLGAPRQLEFGLRITF